jgi:hypothetical protein
MHAFTSLVSQPIDPQEFLVSKKWGYNFVALGKKMK